jgi:starch synthase
MISSEVESLARTGGLGDVVEALSLALAEHGEQVLVVTPLYGVSRVPRGPGATVRWPGPVAIRHGWGPNDVRRAGVVEVATTRFPSGGSRRVCLIDDPALFGRAGIYSDAHGTFGDNDFRFAVMSRGALEISARVWEGGPDVIHAHDWHASFAVLYARLVMGEHWANKPVIFSVHNLAFQGVLDEGALDRLHLPRAAYRPELLGHQGNVNLMKGATALADFITTVSPTYAREILTPEMGFGLDGHLRAHQHRLVGILNGIEARFDPRTDTAIACRYDVDTAFVGRAECKRALASELELEPGDGPLFGIVTRLTWQKGVDLLLPLLDEIVDRGGRVVVVGQGEADLEASLRLAAERLRGRVAARLTFDPPLSRRVYAGCDFFFVPSRFEPCGLTQMYAMHYGAVPVVTDVGGLHDTVEPIDVREHRGTGFVARRADIASLRDVTLAAFAIHGTSREPHDALSRASARGMIKELSWNGPARKYEELYARAIDARRSG